MNQSKDVLAHREVNADSLKFILESHAVRIGEKVYEVAGYTPDCKEQKNKGYLRREYKCKKL